MARPREIRRRIRSVSSTKQITRTMEMIATSRIKRAEERIRAARPYSAKMIEVIQGLAAQAGAIRHPLLEEHKTRDKTAILAFTADRGLCGAFNTNIMRKTEKLIDEQKNEGVSTKLYIVGKKGARYFRYMGYQINESFLGISDKPSFENAREIAGKLMDSYFTGEADKVILIFNRFKSITEQRPIEHCILPLQAELEGEKEKGKHLAECIFEPSASQVLLELIPTYVETVVYRALLESAASELGARRMAMKAATDNAQKMIESLTLSYNKVRQAQITQELAEIVGGAEALE